MSNPEPPVMPRYQLGFSDPWADEGKVEVGLRLLQQHKKKKDQQVHYLGPDEIDALENPDDRLVLKHIRQAFHSMHPRQDFRPCYHFSRYEIDTLLPAMCRTGRCTAKVGLNTATAVTWRNGEPWAMRILVIHDGASDRACIDLQLHSGEETIPIRDVSCVSRAGLIVRQGHIARLKVGNHFAFIRDLSGRTPLRLAPAELGTFLREVFELAQPPEVNFAPELDFTFIDTRPEVILNVLPPGPADRRAVPQYRGQLRFRYGRETVNAEDHRRRLLAWTERTVYRRDEPFEQVCQDQLYAAGFQEYQFPNFQGTDDPLPEIESQRIPGTIGKLIQHGWEALYDDKPFRPLTAVRLSQQEEAKGFKLNGVCDFTGSTLDLLELLKQVKPGQSAVVLEGGEPGWLTDDWPQRLLLLKRLSGNVHEPLCFRSNQVALLNALLDQLPTSTRDESFDAWTRRREAFTGIRPQVPEGGFTGKLRTYQQEGLGWMTFLRTFDCGGCLADDMGLGKTVQVLALLAGRVHERRKGPTGKDPAGRATPSLVVAPKSVVYNWCEEAARFAPELTVLAHEGSARKLDEAFFLQQDLIVTTYGILRNDFEFLATIEFDYIILDEAQNIRNAQALTSRTARVLNANHRLALTGTPVENKAADLWSIFEFLNPGMLGQSSLFEQLAGEGNVPAEANLPILRKALSPYILRRTKAQVARDLPEKTEMTLCCSLEGAHLDLYERLRTELRSTLLTRIQEDGIARSKMNILTVLLRLRQAACHPGLIDPAFAAASCPKFELLLENLEEIAEEGSKALVFSQFTALLALLRKRMETEGLTYEYLDGRTRDRKSRVERFQNDPHCPFFLISLKAGGQGLNLTAANYVYLLDPWWNPAAEAQAVDRTHRIGQTQHVFAYRMITRGTVEERVADLQARKRELADALIAENGSLLHKMTAEDLELLLS